MTRNIAWVFGIVFLALGLLGFLPPVASGGYVLGIFASDVMHNIVYILTGGLAILAAWSSEENTYLYFKIFSVIYAIFTAAGFIAGGTILGLMTTSLADNFLHLIATAAALWLGFGAPQEAPHRAA